TARWARRGARSRGTRGGAPMRKVGVPPGAPPRGRATHEIGDRIACRPGQDGPAAGTRLRHPPAVIGRRGGALGASGTERAPGPWSWGSFRCSATGHPDVAMTEGIRVPGPDVGIAL